MCCWVGWGGRHLSKVPVKGRPQSLILSKGNMAADVTASVGRVGADSLEALDSWVFAERLQGWAVSIASPGEPSRRCGVLCSKPTALSWPHQSARTWFYGVGETVAHVGAKRQLAQSLCSCAHHGAWCFREGKP